MSRSLPWSRHYQNVWHERSGDSNLPYWLRVACLAYGSHNANGHAMFKPGQIGLVLGHIDADGVPHPLDKQNVQRAINKAIEFGWITDQSGSRCLVVPGHAVAGGLGNPSDRCPQAHRRRKGSHSVTYPEAKGTSSSDYPVRHLVTTGEPMTSENVTALYDSSKGSKSSRRQAPGSTPPQEDSA